MRALSGAVAFFSAAYIATRVATFGCGVSPRHPAVLLFDLNREMNLPALYSGGAILLCAFLLAAAAAGDRRRGRPFAAWAGLALIFAFLSGDELFSFHERLNVPLHLALGTSQVLHYAWVVPYAAITALLGAVYLPFLRRLPKRTRWLFILSGMIYVGGAVGCEAIGGLLSAQYGKGSLPHAAEILMEEAMEMSGIVVFIYALLSYVGTELSGMSLRVSFNGSR